MASNLIRKWYPSSNLAGLLISSMFRILTWARVNRGKEKMTTVMGHGELTIDWEGKTVAKEKNGSVQLLEASG